MFKPGIAQPQLVILALNPNFETYVIYEQLLFTPATQLLFGSENISSFCLVVKTFIHVSVVTLAWRSWLCLKSRTSNKRCEIMSNRGPSFCGNKECFRFAFWNERGLKHEHLINQQRSFKDYIFRNLNYNQSNNMQFLISLN